MQWDSIKLFLAIASTGSLAAAAREMAVNHSTVFRRLNSFEAELGGRLFERLASGYQLTPLGEEVLARAKAIQTTVEDLERSVLGKDVQPRGIVRITAPNNIAYRYLPRYCREFRQSYPDIKIELLVSNQEFNMSNRQADIAVRATDAPPEHLIGRKVQEISWGVFAGKGYGSRRPTSMKELRQHRLVGPAGALKNLKIYRWLEARHADNFQMRCDDLVAMSHIAETGIALAILPDDQIRPGLIRLFDVEPAHVSSLWLLTHPDLRNTERIRLVMDMLAEAFRNDRIFMGKQLEK